MAGEPRSAARASGAPRRKHKARAEVLKKAPGSAAECRQSQTNQWPA